MFFRTLAFIMLSFLLVSCDQSTDPIDTYTHSGLGVVAASISKDGHQALVSTVDVGVQFWDLETKKLKFRLKHNDKSEDIIAIAIANDAPIAATLDSKTLVVWDTRSGQAFRYLALQAYPTAIALSKTGKYALIGFANYSAQLIDLTKGTILRRFEHADIVNTVALSDDGQYAVIGSDDSAVRVWDLNSGTMKHQWFHPAKVTHVNISSDNQFVMSASSQHKTWIHRLSDGQLAHDLKLTRKYNLFRTPPPSVTASIFTKDSKTLITGHPPKMIKFWDVETGSLKKELIIPQRSMWRPTASVVLALALSADEKFIIAETSNGMGYRFNINFDTNKDKVKE